MIIFVGLFALLLLLFGAAAIATLIVMSIAKQSEQQVQAPRKMPESQYARDAEKLIQQIKDSLKTSPISPNQRDAILEQIKRAPNNISVALIKLQQIRSIKKIAKRSDTENIDAILDDVRAMEKHVLAELDRMHETLLSVPVSLMKIDVAKGSRNIERIVQELSDMNARLSDVADAYTELREEDVRNARAASNLN